MSLNEFIDAEGDTLLQSLLVVCHLHNRNVHPEAIVSGLPLERGMLTPAIFERAAKRAQFSSRLVNKSISSLNTALYPAILLLNGNRACVLRSINDDGQAVVIFPELPDSETTLSLADLEKDYSGYCIYVRPEYLAYDKSNNPFGTARKGHWFWAVIKQNYDLYRDIVFAAIVINLLAIATPLFVMNVYDRVVPNSAFSTLWMLSIGMFIVLIADLTLKLLRSWFIDLAASRTDIRLSARILDHILSLSLKHRPNSSGTLAASVYSFESVRSFISSLTLTALADLPFLLLFIIVVLLISWPLAVPILVGSVAIITYALISQYNMRNLAFQGMEAGAERNALLVESLGNLETVKGFNLHSDIQSRWEQLNIIISHNSAKMRFLSTSVSQAAAWVQQLTGISILIVGVYLVSAGELSQGGLIAAYLLASRALAPVSQVAALLAQFHQASTAMESLELLMDLPSEQPIDSQRINRPMLEGNIEFKGVHFAYPGSELQALNQVSFKIKSGERIAIIGKNGSGKSTIEKLILGLYPVTEGSIYMDGVDIRQLDTTQLRRNIGYVPQDVSLLLGSLKQNIVADAHGQSDESILRIVQQVGLTPMIQRQPEGLEMSVGERGQKLSGGQRQAVAIARALINDPAILILDEPTSALDHSNEELVIKLLAERSKDKTLILITHRTPLLALIDRLIVMDQGRVIADGPKENIMEALRQGRITGAA